jgi:hypothetical protein
MSIAKHAPVITLGLAAIDPMETVTDLEAAIPVESRITKSGRWQSETQLLG